MTPPARAIALAAALATARCGPRAQPEAPRPPPAVAAPTSCDRAARLRAQADDARDHGRLEYARRLLVAAAERCPAQQDAAWPALLDTLQRLQRPREAQALAARIEAVGTVGARPAHVARALAAYHAARAQQRSEPTAAQIEDETRLAEESGDADAIRRAYERLLGVLEDHDGAFVAVTLEPGLPARAAAALDATPVWLDARHLVARHGTRMARLDLDDLGHPQALEGSDAGPPAVAAGATTEPARRVTFTGCPSHNDAPEFSADGARVLVSSGFDERMVFCVADARTGRRIGRVAAGPSLLPDDLALPRPHFAASPMGLWLQADGGLGAVHGARLMRVSSGHEVLHARDYIGPLFDGADLALTASGESPRVRWVDRALHVGADLEVAADVPDWFEERETEPLWIAAQGERVVRLTRTEVRLLDARALRTLPAVALPFASTAASLAPDGGTLAVAGPMGVVALLDVRAGRLLEGLAPAPPPDPALQRCRRARDTWALPFCADRLRPLPK